SAVPSDVETVERDHLGVHGAHRPHVDHGGKIVMIENAIVSHVALGSAAFLIRRTDNVDTEVELIAQLVESKGGPHAGAAAGAVSAGMTHALQGVVFGQ